MLCVLVLGLYNHAIRHDGPQLSEDPRQAQEMEQVYDLWDPQSRMGGGCCIACNLLCSNQ